MRKLLSMMLFVAVPLTAAAQQNSITPLDPEWMATALREKSLKLEGRIQESGGLLPTVAVTITSPTNDLREFLRQPDVRIAFSESGRMSFHRK